MSVICLFPASLWDLYTAAAAEILSITKDANFHLKVDKNTDLKSDVWVDTENL